MTQRPFSVEVQSFRVGRDYVFHLTGGEAHIGAVATAYLKDGKVEVQLITVPGHREDELAVEFAKAACEKYYKTVTAIVGIHIDQATKDEIKTAVHMAREAMQKAISGDFDIL